MKLTAYSQKYLVLKKILKEKRYLYFGYLKYDLLNRGLPIVDIKEIDVIINRLDEFDVIAFDVFDTCLSRTLNSYKDAPKLKATTYNKLTKQNIDYRALWKKAYSNAFKKHNVHVDEVTQSEIFEEFCKLSDNPFFDVNLMIQNEKEVEIKLSYKNTYVFKIYEKALELRKRIIFISDMYLPASTLEKMLEKNGYGKHKIYVGSEERKTKYSGKMFEVVLKKENIEPHKMLLIGDNLYSDIKMAEKYGVKSFYCSPRWIERSIYDVAKDYLRPCNLPLNASLSIGLARKKHLELDFTQEKDVLYNIGYEVVGPTHLFFILWLIKRAKTLGLTNLHFIARDGYFLEKSFQKIKKKFDLTIEGKYVYASRRLTYLSNLQGFDNNTIEKLTSAFQTLKVSDFLTRININVIDDRDAYRRHGFSGPDQILTDVNGAFLNKDFKKSLIGLLSDYKDEICEKINSEKQLLLDYYHECGLTNSKSAIIDVGWNATSMKDIGNLLKSEKLEYPMGFYFGTWNTAKSLLDDGFNIESFFMKFGEPRERRQVVKGNIAILELFFTANHPTIVGLSKLDGKWIPEYGASERNKNEELIIENLYKGVQDYIDDMIEAPGFNYVSAVGYVEILLKKFLNNPEYDQAKALGKFRHRISFGAVSEMMPIAKVPEKGEKKKDLLRKTLWVNGTKSLIKGK